MRTIACAGSGTGLGLSLRYDYRVLHRINIAFVADANDEAASALGTIPGVGGGMIRDILARDGPGVLTDGRLHMVAALAGAGGRTRAA